jgi:hypothetical protein
MSKPKDPMSGQFTQNGITSRGISNVRIPGVLWLPCPPLLPDRNSTVQPVSPTRLASSVQRVDEGLDNVHIRFQLWSLP